MSNENNVKVTIVCTAFNHERYIRQTLNGFLMQKTNFPFEVLINDDASTDHTAEIIREYEQKYPNIIKPTYQTENQHSKGRAVSLPLFQRARGEYVAWCEGDDFWIDENKLQQQVDFMDANPSFSLCAHAAYRAYEDGVFMKDMFRAFGSSRKVATEEVVSRWLFPTASLLYRRSMRKIMPEPFKQNAPVGDYPLAVYLATEGDVYYIDKPMCAYRVNSVSSLSRQNANQLSKAVKTQEGLMALADRINAYTEGKYTEAVATFKRNCEYNRLVILHKRQEIISSEYYSSFSRGQKLRLWLKVYLYWLTPVINRLRTYQGHEEYKRCRQAMEGITCSNVVILSDMK